MQRSMKAAKVVCLIVIAVMTVHMYCAFSTMGVTAGSAVFYTGYTHNAWQAFINSDLMMGLVLMSCWLIYREHTRSAGISLVLILLDGGNVVAAAYIYYRLHDAKGDWSEFYSGTQSAQRTAQNKSIAPIARATLGAVAIVTAASI